MSAGLISWALPLPPTSLPDRTCSISSRARYTVLRSLASAFLFSRVVSRRSSRARGIALHRSGQHRIFIPAPIFVAEITPFLFLFFPTLPPMPPSLRRPLPSFPHRLPALVSSTSLCPFSVFRVSVSLSLFVGKAGPAGRSRASIVSFARTHFIGIKIDSQGNDAEEGRGACVRLAPVRTTGGGVVFIRHHGWLPLVKGDHVAPSLLTAICAYRGIVIWARR